MANLRVASFNIFYALRRGLLMRTALAAFARLKPDLIALQEVWTGGKQDFSQDLSRSLGYQLSFATRSGILGKKIGMAILTRNAPQRTESILLPPARSVLRPRILQSLEIGSKETPWIVAHAHLESIATKKTRRKQLETILGKLQFQNSPCPQILLGDFNTNTKKEVLAFDTLLAETGFEVLQEFPYTWKMLGMRKKLDWIAVRNCQITSGGMVDSVRGSDHKPIWADIKYNGMPEKS